MTKNKYSEEQEKIARYAKALSHPVRIQILQILSQQSCCYSGDIVDDLPIARSTLSQHLTELREAGLIQGEFNPPKIKYCIRTEAWNEANQLFDLFFKNKNGETATKNSCSTKASKSK
ncbi:MAG: metalloregulator ArsR/SmtB family transcription factor [Bacteroidota bacterium]